MKNKSAIAVLAAGAMMLGACGGETDDTNSNATRSEGNEVVLVVAQGGLGDQSFNDLAHKGFTKATEENGISGSVIESNDIVGQGEQLLRRAAQSGATLILDLEYSHNEIISTVAADYPNKNWVLVNAEAEGDNIAPVLFQEQEASYLAGVLAATQTTNTDDPNINAAKKIGVIGGTQSVGIDKFIIGYIQGAKSVDEEIEVSVAYANSFGDPAKGQQLAQTMFDADVDIIFTVAGGTGSGVIQAAKASGRYAIGVDDNQDGDAPGNVLTSVLKHTDIAMEDVINKYADGSFPGGETQYYGLSEGGVGLTEFEHTADAIGEETIAKLKEIEQQIIDGDIEVWNAVTEGYPDFYSGN